MPVLSSLWRSGYSLLTPAVFVVLWSSGYIGAKYGLPYAEPLTFLFLRFGLVVVVLAMASLVLRAPWPKSWAQVGHIAVAGLLVQGGLLGGVFEAIHLGVSAGLSAVIVSIQPLLTGVLVGPLLGEEVRPREWLGLVLGFIGVVLVVLRTLHFDKGNVAGLGLCLASLAAITGGIIYQKKYCAALDLRTGSLIQFTAATLMMLILSALFEHQHVEWTPHFIFALLWCSVVLSIGAMSILFILIRQGAASRVASLFYLVPPVTALMAYLIFGETLGPVALIGMTIAAGGVALVNR